MKASILQRIARVFAYVVGALTAGALSGCSETLRYRTASQFGAMPGGKTVYYATYTDATCGRLGGCGNSQPRVRRCVVNDDNSLSCTDENDANRALRELAR